MTVKRYSVFLCLFLAALVPLWGDEARDNRWRQDLAFLSTELPRRHGNLFFLIPRDQFERGVSELAEAVPSLTDAQVMAGMAKLLAAAGDSHTLLSLTQTGTGFRLLPLALRWFDDGLYVTAAPAEYRRALAARVVAIGEKSVEEAYRAVAAVISHENEAWLRVESPRHLLLPDLLEALGISRTAAPVRFAFEDAGGGRFEMDIDYRPGAPQENAIGTAGYLPLWLRSFTVPYWFVYVDPLRLLYFKYNQCRDAAEDPFGAFTGRLFAVFDSNPVERLVVDLRNNGGGASGVLSPFLQGLQQRQSRFGNPTKFYVLFNGGTFSSAMLNALELKQNRDQAVALGAIRPGLMKILGEPTGGNPTVPWRNGGSFRLPHSGLMVSHTTAAFATRYEPGGAVYPDMAVPFHSSDWFTLHDPVMAAVLADSEATAAAPESAVTVLNSAGFRAGAVAPGSLASAFGEFTGAGSGDAAAVPLPARIGDTELMVNDTPAPLIALRPGQINFQVPAATPAGTARLRVVQAGNTIASGAFLVAPAAPGLFTAGAPDAARPGAILNQDWRLNSQAAPARPGEIVAIYATGQGATDPPAADGAPGPADPPARTVTAPRVYMGGTPAEVVFSGLSPEFPGLWQLNVRVPQEAAPSPRRLPVYVSSGSAAGNPVTVWVAP